jgi:WD40 repeat protein/serine/threonine protein kinase
MSDHNPSEADPFGPIADEFVAAFRQGKRPSVEDFARRYPAHADEIREILPALLLMEKAKTADDAAEQRRQARASAAAAPLQQLGDYQILREVGRGGMGVVYEAQQLSLGRHVAIKVLPAHALLDVRQLGRFQREARSAAKLHHTNIVPVFGVGEQDGLHYYVMQFIPGLGLDTVLNELRRLRHPRGKKAPTQADARGQPTNGTRDVSAVDVVRGLLTGAFTASGEPPKDEGGRRKDERSEQDAPDSSFLLPPSSFSSATIHLPGQTEASTLSESGNQYWQSVARVGVQVADALAHAASQGVLHRDIKPSNLLLDDTGNVWLTDFGLAKAASDGNDLTHTGDIVGTLRYLAPERFSGQGDLRSDVYSLGLTLYELLALRPAFDEADRNKLVKQVLHDEPVRPRKLNPAVPRDLETVVLKAIARDPAHRYQTPTEMAEDLKRFVEDRPVRARRASLPERFWRWCRRNPGIAGLTLAVLVLSVTVAVGSSLAAWRIAAARDNEERERRRAEEHARQSHQGLVQLQITKGLQLMDTGDLSGALAWFTRALQLDAGEPAEAMHRIRITAVMRQCPRLAQMWFHAGPAYSVEFSPDGRSVVTAGDDRIAQVWDLASGAAVTPPLRHRDMVTYAMFSPDGRRVLTCSRDGSARVWDAATGEPLAALQHAGAIWQASFSRDSRLVVTASDDRTARVWDAASGQPVTPPLCHEKIVWQAAFSSDGRWVITGSEDQTAKVWDAASGRLALPILQHQAVLESVEFSPDGRRLLTVAGDMVYLWDAGTGQPLFPARKLSGSSRRCTFTPDGRHAVLAGGDTVQIWDMTTGLLLPVRMQHPVPIWHVAVSPDGRRLATVGGNAARLWDALTGQPLSPLLKHNGLANHAAFSPDGRFLATTGGETANVWDTATVQPAVTSLKECREMGTAVFSADARYLAGSGLGTGQLGIWDTASGETLAPPQKYQGAYVFAAFSADGRLLITTHNDRTAAVWELATGKLLCLLPAQEAQVRSAVLSSDNRLALTACEDKTARVWDAATGCPQGQILRHPEAVSRLAFHPDSRRVLTTCVDWTAQVWDWTSGERIGRPLKHGGPLWNATFSPDGSRVLTASHDRTARIWNAATGEPLTPPLQHQAQVVAVAFSPDGRYVATGTSDATARVWEAATGLPLTLPLKHTAAVRGVVFSSDGQLVLSATADGKLWQWDLGLTPDNRPTEDLQRLAQLLDGHQLDAAGGFVPAETATLRALWQQLRISYPRDFVFSADAGNSD